jgi:RNA polymerase sigma-70 factor (ECF subfamily)
MDTAERIIIKAALAGDDEAFETVIRTYSRRVYVVAYSIVQDIPEAEDIVQETFLKAHQQRRTLREPEKFPAWLLTVTRNAARDRLRRRRPQAGTESFDTLIDPAVTPGSAMERAERQTHLRRALATLPEEHRTALTLRYLEGLDYRAIETSMGVSNGALRGILGRALGTLRRMPALQFEMAVASAGRNSQP